MLKEDVEDFYEFHFRALFYSSFSFAWHLPRVCEKVNWQNLFQIPCSCGRSLDVIIGCENFLPLKKSNIKEDLEKWDGNVTNIFFSKTITNYSV